ncbi:spore coat protein [Nitrospira sp. KM1]|uniref:DegT/DnrJ/EryC1/StrS family aminotransferase n=1 Tax=Nitrospira sp. KM1 TaxID=1936990 RepID=UPI0013A79ED9|nr:DegT/DnrJ/EryC1/StrS family aminotransferase [Nitrospira sp. KM1]BCA54218.1 spore coat protein [Nitrospira sp. KM1]
MDVPFYQHDLGEPELEAVRQVLAGPILTTGEVAVTFERRFADYLGSRHALAVSSCTGALHLSLLGLGVGAGDQVITTPMTFIATSTAILEAGARPIFVDVEPETGNLDASLIEAAITERTKAIIPVHLYGQMCDMRAIRRIADRHGLFVIEDAAHCIEGVRDGVRPGELADTACFSFYATKNLTCGEGGALVTNNESLYASMKLLRLHGMTKTAADRHKEGYQHWDMTALGWKYNMDNLHAALLLPQLNRLDAKLESRHRLARLYEERLSGLKDISWPQNIPGSRHARHLFPIWIDRGRRDRIIASLQRSGVGVVVNYRAIHLLTYFQQTFSHRAGDFPIAERIGDQTLSLPFYPTMPDEHVDWVVSALRSAL